MSTSATSQPGGTFASGRYSKRKRTPISYNVDELVLDSSDSDSEYPLPKKPKAKKASAKPLPRRRIFPFMELPAEIRNMIYSFALLDPGGINLVATTKHYRRGTERIPPRYQPNDDHGDRSAFWNMDKHFRDDPEKPYQLILPLLAVSKQIYHEGRDMLYSNEFVFGNVYALYAFLINLGPVTTKYLKTLRVLRWGHNRTMRVYNHTCFAALVWATNITTLRIDEPSDYQYAGKEAALQFYRDAFPWLEAFGVAKGRADAAVDVIKFGEHECDIFRVALRKLVLAQQSRAQRKPLKKVKPSRHVGSDDES